MGKRRPQPLTKGDTMNNWERQGRALTAEAHRQQNNMSMVTARRILRLTEENFELRAEIARLKKGKRDIVLDRQKFADINKG